MNQQLTFIDDLPWTDLQISTQFRSIDEKLHKVRREPFKRFSSLSEEVEILKKQIDLMRQELINEKKI